MLPPLPPWTGLHPLVVHFPIALLLVAPILVVLSIIWSRPRTELAAAALLLMVIGTIGAIVAVSTGKAAGELADRTLVPSGALEQHEELAETTRNVFALLTSAFAAIVAVPLVRRRAWSQSRYAVIAGVFLLFYAGGALALVNAAHYGGRLVHQYGVRAMVGPTPADAGAPTPSGENDRH